ncbi:hypothetical protein CDAR_421721 [Caerostris darwini]|uniref:Uncharacterized protein n=1 Tax=Caerostris darwini TaxID=1538125 RepID=A0AAV4V0K9_9ARAC|nr:hypothetical protein CDAR_421721 [Caerostris darwini]
MMLFGLFFSISTLTLVLVESVYHVEKENSCSCVCKENFIDYSHASKPFCQILLRFEKELLAMRHEIERRTHYINEIEKLKEIAVEQEDRLTTLEEQIEILSKKDATGESLPTPASLVLKPDDDYMLGDSGKDVRAKEDKELANNVSNLIAKVEEVENLTSQVQEELKSERRVRRHLEEDLNETRTSIKLLDDKLQNVTLPMDSRVAHVEEVVFSTLENMNKTLFEDHLNKLYYKVNGVAYKNETRKIDERLDQVETELLDVSNINATLQIAQELKSLSETLNNLNQTVTEKLSAEELRLDNLENKTMRLDGLEGVDELILNLLNTSKDVHKGLSEVWNNIDAVRNTTLDLEKELSHQATENSKSISDAKLELSGKLDTLSGDLSSLKEDVAAGQESVSELKKDVQILEADITVTGNKVQQLDTESQERIRNVTLDLERELSYQTAKNSISISDAKLELSGKLDTLSGDLSSLKKDVASGQESIAELRKDVQILEADVAVTGNRVQQLDTESQEKIKTVFSTIENLTNTWHSSMSDMVKKIAEWKNSKDGDSGYTYLTVPPPTIQIVDDPVGGWDIDEGDQSARLNKGTKEKRCRLPAQNDSNLLVSMEMDENGKQRLIFGCRPVGRYVMSGSQLPIHCEDGAWHGTFPKCLRLLNESEVTEISHLVYPCYDQTGDVPDLADCEHFYKCSFGNTHRFKCPNGLHFDKQSRNCLRPVETTCTPTQHLRYASEDVLKDVIPTIVIDPDHVDKPRGLMATGDAGQLIVYPRTTLRLHCLFPKNDRGTPVWHKMPFSNNRRRWPMASEDTPTRVTITLTSVAEIDSGIYSCENYAGIRHDITILVIPVRCPEIKNLTFIPGMHPSGEHGILSTTAEFPCDDGRKIVSMCLPNGTWSNLPTPEECPQKKTEKPTLWGCPLNITDDNLTYYTEDSRRRVRFMCSGNTMLIGDATSNCVDGKWNHAFPECKAR